MTFAVQVNILSMTNRRSEALTPEPQPAGGFIVDSYPATAQRVSAGPIIEREFPNRRKSSLPRPAPAAMARLAAHEPGQSPCSMLPDLSDTLSA